MSDIFIKDAKTKMYQYEFYKATFYEIFGTPQVKADKIGVRGGVGVSNERMLTNLAGYLRDTSAKFMQNLNNLTVHTRQRDLLVFSFYFIYFLLEQLGSFTHE